MFQMKSTWQMVPGRSWAQRPPCGWAGIYSTWLLSASPEQPCSRFGGIPGQEELLSFFSHFLPHRKEDDKSFRPSRALVVAHFVTGWRGGALWVLNLLSCFAFSPRGDNLQFLHQIWVSEAPNPCLAFLYDPAHPKSSQCSKREETQRWKRGNDAKPKDHGETLLGSRSHPWAISLDPGDSWGWVDEDDELEEDSGWEIISPQPCCPAAAPSSLCSSQRIPPII